MGAVDSVAARPPTGANQLLTWHVVRTCTHPLSRRAIRVTIPFEMTYPGNPELSVDAQQRVLSAFRRAITLLQDSNRREAMIALDFTLRLDPDFEPARNLSNQLNTGSDEIDLGSMITELGLPSAEEIQAKLVDAVDDFNDRRFPEAKEQVQAVLRELPGNQEARRLLAQIDHALQTEAQIGEFLSHAQQNLAQGKPGRAAELLMKAQAVDPQHPGIAPLLHQIQAVAPAAVEQAAPPPAPPSPPPTQAGETGKAPIESPPQPIEFSFSTEADSGGPSVKAAEGFETLPEGAPLFGEEQAKAPAFELETPPDSQGAGPGTDGEPRGTAEASGEQPPLATGDLADLFDEGLEAPPPAAEGPASPSGEEAGRIAELYHQGQAAFEREDFLEAIDIWSRIYLIDPENAQANAAIDEARKRQDEIDRELEQRLFEAQEAADAGDAAKALRVAGEILAAHPENLAARDLEESLKRPGTAVPPPPSPPGEPEGTPPTQHDAGTGDLDAELFEVTASEGVAPPPVKEISEAVPEAISEEPPREAPAARHARPSGMRLVLLGLGAIAIVAIGIWIGSRLISGKHSTKTPASVDRVLAQAEALYKKGQPEKAIRLLEGFHATSMDQVRIARRLTKYRRAVAPPTPTPPPAEAAEAQRAFASGKWLQAYRIVTRGLEAHPGDAGLTELGTKILNQENQIGPLVQAERQRDYETAVGIARELAGRYPKHLEIRQELARDLFNLAVSDLRAYNLTGAANQLQALLKINSSDAEARRILRFIEKYQVRPVDMQLKIFIGSLSYR